jgi:hypothetical protein
MTFKTVQFTTPPHDVNSSRGVLQCAQLQFEPSVLLPSYEIQHTHGHISVSCCPAEGESPSPVLSGVTWMCCVRSNSSGVDNDALLQQIDAEIDRSAIIALQEMSSLWTGDFIAHCSAKVRACSCV